MLGNAVLWCAAIAAAVYEGDTTLFTSVLPPLAAVSVAITYQLFK